MTTANHQMAGKKIRKYLKFPSQNGDYILIMHAIIQSLDYWIKG